MSSNHSITGPILILDDLRDGQMQLAALFIAPKGQTVPPVSLDGMDRQAEPLAEYASVSVLRARFALPADRPSSYQWNGQSFEVAGGFGGDMRIAYAS